MQDGLLIHTKLCLKINDLFFGWLVIFAHRRSVFWGDGRVFLPTACFALRHTHIEASCETESLFIDLVVFCCCQTAEFQHFPNKKITHRVHDQQEGATPQHAPHEVNRPPPNEKQQKKQIEL